MDEKIKKIGQNIYNFSDKTVWFPKWIFKNEYKQINLNKLETFLQY